MNNGDREYARESYNRGRALMSTRFFFFFFHFFRFFCANRGFLQKPKKGLIEEINRKALVFSYSSTTQLRILQKYDKKSEKSEK